MKRLLLVLAALIGFAALGATAQAAPLANCTLASTASQIWPYKTTYLCYGIQATDNDARAFFNTLSNNFSQGWIGQQNTLQGGDFYLFPNAADANKSLAAIGKSIDPTDRGKTFIELMGGVTVVVENFTSIDGKHTFPNDVANTTAHEMGHWLDRFAASATGSTTGYASDSNGFKTEYNKTGTTPPNDVANFNLLGACSPDKNGVAIFQGQDDSNGVAICTGTKLSTTYAGKKNWDVVLAAWPPLVPIKGNPVNSEVFAELTAVAVDVVVRDGNQHITDDDYYLTLQNQFRCTVGVIVGLLQSGNPQQSLPPIQICPAFPAK